MNRLTLNRNTGNQNTGNQNTGNQNTGNQNTGNRNTGNQNTGNQNTGSCNTGNWNTGNWNTGNWNSGNWNSGNRNTGYFNTETPTQINIFDCLTDIKEWDNCEKPDFIFFRAVSWVLLAEMTATEKEQNPNWENTKGYLKKKDYKDAFRESYNNASTEDRKKIFNLPNFDAEKFLYISGIDVRCDGNKDKKRAELIAKAEELLKQAKDM